MAFLAQHCGSVFSSQILKIKLANQICRLRGDKVVLVGQPLAQGVDAILIGYLTQGVQRGNLLFELTFARHLGYGAGGVSAIDQNSLEIRLHSLGIEFSPNLACVVQKGSFFLRIIRQAAKEIRR
jgi:hypothetical protein